MATQMRVRVGARTPRMLRVGEAARVLSVHPNTLRKWSTDGMIPSYRFGKRNDRRFAVQDLAYFLASRRLDAVDIQK